MKIGIIGVQNSGKTTIFNALTGLDAEVTPYASQKLDPNLGMVDVGDERIDWLTAQYEPKKTVNATIEYIDFAGLSSGAKRGDVFSSESMNLMKTADAYVVVLRNFPDPSTGDAPAPVDELSSIESNLIFTDLMVAEKRLERIALSKKRGIKDNSLLIEERAIEKIIAACSDEIPVHKLELPSDELKAIRGFQFLSQKPLLVILNSPEDSYGSNDELLASLAEKYATIEFAGNFEMELIALDDEEAAEFMQDMGIETSARDRLTKASYDLLGYISFFTVGKDEVRAWTITKGDNAVEAAGKIHSDLARGFIRAECFSYDALRVHGSEKALRDHGLFRLEGKDYIVQDGDILNIRFSV
jgi:hypothetical protein